MRKRNKILKGMRNNKNKTEDKKNLFNSQSNTLSKYRETLRKIKDVMNLVVKSRAEIKKYNHIKLINNHSLVIYLLTQIS